MNQQDLEALTKKLSSDVSRTVDGCPGEIGYMLMIFDYGPQGFCAYSSNAQRADMIELLRQQANRLEAMADRSQGEA